MVSRYECLQYLVQIAENSLVVIWGTGARAEWWHLQPNPPSMPTAMGYAIPMGVGLALALPHRQVIVIDGDGGLLSNLGVLATLGNLRPDNLKVFVIDNECYESVGGPPTATAGNTNLVTIARGTGIEQVKIVRTLKAFKDLAHRALANQGLNFIVIKVEKGRKNTKLRK